MISLDHVWILPIAIVIDALAGDPPAIWNRIRHPVAVIGSAITVLDKLLNRDRFPAFILRLLGALSVMLVTAATAAIGYGAEFLLARVPFGWIGIALVAAIMLAGRSLYDHVRAVAAAFTDGLPAARAAIAHIVGRDSGSLDGPRICRAAIESTAENLSDGVIAPALWFAVLGLPGMFAYKAVNTVDSMIGHRGQRYADFGWAAARLDDLMNLPASRVSGPLVALAAPLARGSVNASFRTMMRDASKHRSPNAGWPEAAMAGALGVAVAGPRRYGGTLVDDPFLNAGGRHELAPSDIRRGLRVYVGAVAAFFVVVSAAALVVLR